MNLTDFYPADRWTVIKSNHIVIDKSTGKQYPYRAANDLRAKYARLTVLTPIVHIAVSVAFIGLKILKLISFWHFWKSQQNPYDFDARLMDAGKDLLKIVTTSFAILALEFLSFYGLFRPYKAMKLYCSIEEFQYDRHVMMSFFNLTPLPSNINAKFSNHDQSSQSKKASESIKKASEPSKQASAPSKKAAEPIRKPSVIGPGKKPNQKAQSQSPSPTHGSRMNKNSQPMLTKASEPINLGKCENAKSLCNTLATLQDDDNWESISLRAIDLFIQKNLKTIVSEVTAQNETKPQAKKLQDLLFKLSTKINEKFDNPLGHNLAFTIQGIAQGIVNSGFNWEGLPNEIKNTILLSDPQNIKNVAFTSMEGKEIALQAKRDWVVKAAISFKGCKTAAEASVILHDLCRVILNSIPLNIVEGARGKALFDRIVKHSTTEFASILDTCERLKILDENQYRKGIDFLLRQETMLTLLTQAIS